MTHNSDNKKLFILLLKSVSSLQNGYIDIHNQIMNQKLGQVIDYNSALEDLDHIKEVLDDTLKLLEKIDTKNIEKHSLDILETYINELQDAIEALIIIIHGLISRANNSRYTFFQYLKDRRNYKKLNNRFAITGIELNKIYQYTLVTSPSKS